MRYESQGFGTSLFERLMAIYVETASRRLTTQYRMHEAIMEFSSLEFYEAELVADDSVSRHLLRDLPGVYVVGEMLDWEAPTGGYLLQATFSTAVVAARAALRRLRMAGPSA